MMMKINTKILKNWFLKFLIRNRVTVTIILGIVLILVTQFVLKKNQENLSPIAIEMIGAFIIILLLEFYLINIWLKSSYPETKALIFNRLIGVLRNLSLDIVSNFLRISDNDSSIINDPIKLKTTLSDYKEENRNQIEAKYISLSQENIESWSRKIDNYKKILNDYFNVLPLIRPKDEDLACILDINRRITDIQEELRKSLPIRTSNKKFFSSDLCFLSQTIIRTIDNGFYDSIIFKDMESSIIERSNN